MRIYPTNEIENEDINDEIDNITQNSEIVTLDEISSDISLDLEAKTIDKRDINEFKSNTSSESDIDYDNLCIICLDNCISNNILLSCNHIFHSQCITEWSIIQVSKQFPASCPICKLEYDFTEFSKKILQKYIEQIKTIIAQLDFIIYNAKLVKIQKNNIIKLKKSYSRAIVTIKKIKDPTNFIFVNLSINPLPLDIIILISEIEIALNNKIISSTNNSHTINKSYKDMVYLFKNPQIICRYILKLIKSI